MYPTTQRYLSKPDPSIKLVRYDHEDLPAVMTEVAYLIERSIAYSKGTVTMQQIIAFLNAGEAHMFGTVKDGKILSVFIGRIVVYPSDYSVFRIIACAGRDLKAALVNLEALEAWVICQGAVEIEAFCRPSMYRLLRRLGWNEKMMIVSRDLRRKLQ